MLEEKNKSDSEEIKYPLRAQDSTIDKQNILGVIKEYLKSSAFSDRKLTDTPTDSFSVVNRRYVTLNGALTARPVSSVATVGQRYFDTTNNVPIFYTVAGWRNSSGSVVALNN